MVHDSFRLYSHRLSLSQSSRQVLIQGALSGTQRELEREWKHSDKKIIAAGAHLPRIEHILVSI